MEESTMSEKLTRIKTATDRIRVKTDTASDSIEDVATAVEGLKDPTGNVDITTTSAVDVTNYATAQVVDSNLIAENIRKNTTVLGITGSLEEGITPTGTYNISSNGTHDVTNYANANVAVVEVEAEEKDINFYDYDGFRIASWSLSELSGKTALPDNPRQHNGLIFQEWNWTLAQLKSHNRKACVGALYKTDDDATRIYLDLPYAMTISLKLRMTSGVSFRIEWGDGGVSNYTGTGEETDYSHYYTAGKKKISIFAPSNGTLAFCGGTKTLQGSWNMFGKLNNTNYALFNSVYRIELSGLFDNMLNTYAFNRLYNLRYFICSTKADNPGAYTFYDCEGLKTIFLPQGSTSIGTYCFELNQALEYASVPYTCTNFKTDAFRKCYVLKELTIPNRSMTFGNYAFASCDCVKTLEIPSTSTIPSYCFAYTYNMIKYTIPSNVTSIEANAFLNCYSLKELHFKGTTPPTVADASAFSGLPTSCKIYVPSSKLSTYKNANNYPSSSSYTYVGE